MLLQVDFGLTVTGVYNLLLLGYLISAFSGFKRLLEDFVIVEKFAVASLLRLTKLTAILVEGLADNGMEKLALLGPF